jgi:hypothetical protein
VPRQMLFFLFYRFYIYSHVYTLFGTPSYPPLQAEPVLALLFSNFVKEIIKRHSVFASLR